MCHIFDFGTQPHLNCIDRNFGAAVGVKLYAAELVAVQATVPSILVIA